MCSVRLPQRSLKPNNKSLSLSRARKDRIKRGKPLETNTHVDTVIKTENLLILVEMKFTSDISTQTTFGSNRNQLARTIDVGISKAKKKGKKLVVLLCSPSEFYHKKSRFYYYKMQEYSDFHKIKQDICWRELEEIKECLLSTAWIPLEKVIKITRARRCRKIRLGWFLQKSRSRFDE